MAEGGGDGIPAKAEVDSASSVSVIATGPPPQPGLFSLLLAKQARLSSPLSLNLTRGCPTDTFPVAGCRRLYVDKYKSTGSWINVSRSAPPPAIQMRPRPPGGQAGRPRGEEWRGGCVIPARNRPQEKESMWQDMVPPLLLPEMYTQVFMISKTYIPECVYTCVHAFVYVCVHLCDVALQCWDVLGQETQEVEIFLLLYIQL